VPTQIWFKYLRHRFGVNIITGSEAVRQVYKNYLIQNSIFTSNRLQGTSKNLLFFVGLPFKSPPKEGKWKVFRDALHHILLKEAGLNVHLKFHKTPIRLNGFNFSFLQK